MANFILIPFGSTGDVNPFIWLGALLRARGHEVTLMTFPLFRESVETAGISFAAAGCDEEFAEVLGHPHLWKPVRASALVFGLAARATRPLYDEIVPRLRKGETVLVAPLSVFAARAIREKYGVPLVNVHLQPSALLSVHDETIFLPGAEWMARLPVWMKKLMFVLPNPADLAARKTLRAFCKEIGIAPPRRVLPDWLFSPDANLALFPEWFAPRQPDWPEKLTAAGFPLEDLGRQSEVPDDVASFLAKGEKTVLLTAGTGNAQAEEFFRIGIEACAKIGRRALIGTRFPAQLPQPLPAHALVFGYIPFSKVLPQTAAIVHHGGIGTVSQAFAAGLPQLLMPLAHDQPDNALRVKRLGAGDYLTPRRFTVANVARALDRLIRDQEMAATNRRLSQRCADSHAADAGVRVIESLVPASENRTS